MTQKWQQDVTKERKKLNKKLHKLVDFIDSKDFEKINRDMQNLLVLQSTVMATYINVLNTRLEYIDN